MNHSPSSGLAPRSATAKPCTTGEHDPGTVLCDCPKDAELSAWLQDPFNVECDAARTAHFDSCTSCQRRLEQLDHAAERQAAAAADSSLLQDLRRQPPVDDLETEAECAGAGMRAASASLRSSEFETDQLSEAADVAPHTRLGNYEILGVLGRGGMGVVYKAKQLKANRVVALKMILTNKHASVQEQVRFQMEAEAVARLQHPNIVQLHEVGEHDGLPYFSIEFCEGGSLEDKLKSWTPNAAEAAALIATLARAIHYAHLRGVVHRDLKPANVLLAGDGTPKITDFGLAKNLDSSSDITKSGAIMGTPSYMAPEQAEGKVHNTGPAADVYALGALLYLLLAGRPPFKGNSVVETLDQVRKHEPTPPSRWMKSVPRDLDTICLKCLRKQPENRYASAAELADELIRYQKGEPILARPVGAIERSVRWVRRNPTVAVLLAGVVLTTIAGVTGIAWQWRKAVANARIANQLTDEARQKTKAERWERYRANMAVAGTAMHEQNFTSARRNLEAAPEEHRGWEWRRLDSLLDGAQTVLEIETKGLNYCPVFDVHPTRLQLAIHQPDGSVGWWDPAADSSFPLPRSHKQTASKIAYSPDGKRVATAADDHKIHIWNAESGQQICVLPGHAKAVQGLKFSRGGLRLASIGLDHVVRLWDLETGASLWARQASGQFGGLAFTPDGTRLVINSGNELLGVLADKNQLDVTYKGHAAVISDLAMSPDGTRLASASTHPENQIRLWELATGRSLAVLAGHLNHITRVTFSSDGRRLASSSVDSTVRLWDARSGDCLRVLSGHTAAVYDLAFSPDGKRLLSGADDETVRLWDGRTGDSLAVMHGHRAHVPRVTFSPDGSKIFSASFDGTVRIWDVQSAESTLLRGHSSFVYDVAFDPDGTQVASVGWDGALRLWDLATGRQVREMKHTAEAVSSVAFDAAGKRLLTLSRFRDQDSLGRTVTVWDRATGKILRMILMAKSNWKDSRAVLNPAGDLIAVGDNEGPVRLFDPTSGKELAVLAGHQCEVTDVAFRPDGAQLASGGADGSIRLWDPVRRSAIAVLRGHDAWVTRLAYSHDGRWLASAAQDKTVRLWDPDSQEFVAEFPHGSAVHCLSFSPDEKRLATGSADKIIRVWDLVQCQEVAELRGHTGYVHAVAWSPDGSRLVSGSGDSTVRVWDSLSPQQRARPSLKSSRKNQ